MPPPLPSQSMQLSDVLSSSSLEAVKAELLEETSQSSSMMGNSSDSRPGSSSTSFSQSSMDSQSVLSPPIKDIFTQNVNSITAAAAAMQANDVKSLQMMVAYQGQQSQHLSPPTDQMVSPDRLVEIKQEIIRRNSSSQDGSYFQQLAHANQMPVSNMMVDPSQPAPSAPLSNQLFNQLQMQAVATQMKPPSSMISIDAFAAPTNQIPMINGGGMPTISQDIVMQDTSIAQLSMTQQINVANPRTAENILNTNIAPSIMCTTLNNQNTVLAPNVIAESGALISHNTTPPQSSALVEANASPAVAGLSTLVPPPSLPQTQDGTTLTISRNTSPVAVKKMILNAAADILTSPEPTQETRSTIKALMAINTDALLNQVPSVVEQNQQQQQQQQVQMQTLQQQTSTHQSAPLIQNANIGGHVVENIFDQNSNTSQMSGGMISSVSSDALVPPSLRVTNMGTNEVNLMNVSRHDLLTSSHLNELNNTIR